MTASDTLKCPCKLLPVLVLFFVKLAVNRCCDLIIGLKYLACVCMNVYKEINKEQSPQALTGSGFVHIADGVTAHSSV